MKTLWFSVDSYIESFSTWMWNQYNRLIHHLINFRLTERTLIVAALMLFVCCDVFAQTDGGFSAATSTIRGYKDDVANLMKAIGAVIAIVGAFNVYYKMQNGDQDVKKTIMLTLGGCIAFVALGEALPSFFGENL